MRSVHHDDPLDDFDRRELTFEGATKVVYINGSGPAVIVLAEMPGISPHVARFARWVRDAGFTTYMPSLFGRDGALASAEEGAAIFQRACISGEFRALGGGKSSPVTNWLRALARSAHEECGGRGVGAVGMCFTGNFALTMMLEPAVLAPVVCQPSLPLDNPGGLEIAPAEIEQIRERLEREISPSSPTASRAIPSAGPNASPPTPPPSAGGSPAGCCRMPAPTPTCRRFRPPRPRTTQCRHRPSHRRAGTANTRRTRRDSGVPEAAADSGRGSPPRALTTPARKNGYRVPGTGY